MKIHSIPVACDIATTLCSTAFMTSGFIIAYIFLVNVHKNRISFLIRKKELLAFVLERGGRGDMRKQKLMGLVFERRLCKFLTSILLEKIKD